MQTRFSLPVLLLFGLGSPFIGCGSDVDTSDAAGGAPGTTNTTSVQSTGTAGATGGASTGDCDDDTDCPGSKCVELTPGGFLVCAQAPVEASSCVNPEADECCASAECTPPAKCFPAPPSCGGPGTLEHNVCIADQCQSTGECQIDLEEPFVAICLQAGVIGNAARICVFAPCLTSADCAEEAGGICAPILDPCGCGVSIACVYPQGGCRSSADCPSGSYCKSDGLRAECVVGAPECPA